MRPTDPNITPAERAEYVRRTAFVEWEGETLPDSFGDPLWRIANLYSVTDENGDVVHFEPTEEQIALLICIYIRGLLRIVIPKARQLGMSTLLAIIACDGLFFVGGFHGCLIDKTAPDAEKKMRDKIHLAWDKLPESLRAGLVENRRREDHIAIQAAAGDEAESTFDAAINYRGGTVSFMWISEWGWVQDNDRDRSRKIATGALPAIERAEHGLCVVETTWSGGLDAELGPIVEEALNVPESQKGPKSWRVVFFGWQTCPKYVRDYGHIDTESAKYFAEIEAKYGVVLTQKQKFWYAEKRRTAKNQRKFREEYPTVVEECWESVPEGSIYGSYIATARAEGRIVDFLPDTRYPVDTFWDIGLPINTVTWLLQIRPEAIMVLDCLFEEDIQFSDRVAWLNAKGFTYRHHFFPHDANNSTLPQMAEFIRQLGPGCRMVPKVARVTHGIELLQAQFSRLVFHKTKCAKALEYLGRYRAERESSTGISKLEPVHDRYSHPADALRQFAQAMEARLIPNAHIIGAAAEQNKPAPRAVLPRGFR